MNILGLNRVLIFVHSEWAEKLFGPVSTYVSDEEKRRGGNSHLGVAGARLGLWRALVHLLAYARPRHDVLLLELERLLRHEQEWNANSRATGCVELLHSIQHQSHTLWTAHHLTAQEGSRSLRFKTQ